MYLLAFHQYVIYNYNNSFGPEIDDTCYVKSVFSLKKKCVVYFIHKIRHLQRAEKVTF